jgi:lipopolysaccharide/colanic/teichoic acid biosynthesis glycosyltransferase
VAEYTSEQKAVLLVKPGITDPGSLRYRDEGRLLQQNRDPQRLYREKILPDKLALNLQYLKDISFARDLHLIVSTIKSVIGLPDTSEFD